jgi:hypothetical protein
MCLSKTCGVYDIFDASGTCTACVNPATGSTWNEPNSDSNACQNIADTSFRTCPAYYDHDNSNRECSSIYPNLRAISEWKEYYISD